MLDYCGAWVPQGPRITNQSIQCGLHGLVFFDAARRLRLRSLQSGIALDAKGPAPESIYGHYNIQMGMIEWFYHSQYSLLEWHVWHILGALWPIITKLCNYNFVTERLGWTAPSLTLQL